MNRHTVKFAKNLAQSMASTLLASSMFTLLSGCQTVTHESTATKDIKRWPTVNAPAKNMADEAKIKTLLTKMTVEEKVGQILQAEIQTVTADDIKKYHLGSVLNGGGSMPNRNANSAPEDWLKLADSFYEASMDTRDGKVAVPIIWGTDAVHGHNNVYGATLFPHNIGLGATHNPALIKRIGEATAREVRATGIDWVFAPTIAVAQNDFWGRTYESYSEDPALIAQFSGAMVEGLQGTFGSANYLDNQHVLACAKHFIGDGGTFGGDDQGDSRISEQELISVHGAGYLPAIESGAQTVMASFSSWNGEKMHGNRYLLTDVLRGPLNFDGLVVGDWNGHGQVPGCTNDSCAQAINAGVDLIMVPIDWKVMYGNTLAQVKSGEISLARLEQAVSRILRVKIRGGLFDGSPSARMSKAVVGSIGSEAHRAIARQAVRESLVLLKNNNALLPLNPKQTILVAGLGADNIPMQAGGWSITWQGTGTKNSDFPGATSIYSGLKQSVNKAGGKIVLSETGDFKQKPDVAIVVFGEQPYAEGVGDRDTLEFEPGNKASLALLKKLKAQNIPVVSVFLSGRPLWINPELNASDAFVAAWLPGTEGAGISEVLLKDAAGNIAHDFKGNLSFSWPALPLQAEINGPKPSTQPLFNLGYGLTYAKKTPTLAPLPEDVAGITAGDDGVIPFYVGRTQQSWILYIRNGERDQMLSGAFAQLPTGDVTIKTVDKDVQEDALRLSWKDTWRAGTIIREGEPLNLTSFVKAGTVSFDLKVNEFAKADLNIELMCGEGCTRRVSIADFAKANMAKGWQHLSIPLNCFKRDGDSFDAVTQPFNIVAGGKGEIEFANVKFKREGEANFSCPDYRTQSVTPVPQNVYWAADSWMPRHQAIVNNKAKNKAQLVMIGDSITQGWEAEGKTVWQKNYAKFNALNLGIGGDRTEHVLWRLQNGELDGVNAKVAVVMIGTNTVRLLPQRRRGRLRRGWRYILVRWRKISDRRHRRARARNPRPRCASEGALGAQATQRLQVLLNAGPFTLESVDRDVDRYGRSLRVVDAATRQLPDWRNAGGRGAGRGMGRGAVPGAERGGRSAPAPLFTSAAVWKAAVTDFATQQRARAAADQDAGDVGLATVDLAAEQSTQRRADDQAGGAVRTAAIIAVVIAAIDAGAAIDADRLVAATIIAIGPIAAAIARIGAVPVIAVDRTAGAVMGDALVVPAILTPVAAIIPTIPRRHPGRSSCAWSARRS
ncbi:MAG: glycoside hydrolase family 3 N-terminal domain-containing protein [Marinagarivorans sp.]|nr:glycoside hydrolase family 3 N-terminal domain-containing protein [Marinagarivorans sp.]